MGVFLDFKLAAQRISPTQWEETYQEALQIVDGCDLMDCIVAERSSTRFVFARKTAERVLSGQRGFQVCGTMNSGFNMEAFLLFRDLDYYRRPDAGGDNGADILFDSWYPQDPDIPEPVGVCELWGNKTQGKPGHIPLLAIACLFADRFPEAVKIGGDITAGQCRAAVQLANQYLDCPIQPPVTCRAEALATRLRDVNISEPKRLKAFFRLYLGTLTPEVGEILTNVFSADTLYRYFRDELAQLKPEDHDFETAIRNYLLLELSLPRLFRMLAVDEDGSCLSLEQILKKLFFCRVHVPFDEKNCIDPLALDPAVDGDEEEPHEIDAIMGRTFFAMAAGRNHNLPVYVPLEDIRAACRLLDEESDTLIDRLLAEPVVDERQEKVYGNGKDSFINQLQQEAKQAFAELTEQPAYDIIEVPDLYSYRPNCTIAPSLEDQLTGLMHKVQGFDLGGEFQTFLTLDRTGREARLIRANRYILIHETVWEHIFAHIMDDAYIRRYFFLLQVNCSLQNIYDVMEPLINCPALIDELWEKAAAQEAPE